MPEILTARPAHAKQEYIIDAVHRPGPLRVVNRASRWISFVDVYEGVGSQVIRAAGTRTVLQAEEAAEIVKPLQRFYTVVLGPGVELLP